LNSVRRSVWRTRLSAEIVFAILLNLILTGRLRF
jgi:hypothetical protein